MEVSDVTGRKLRAIGTEIYINATTGELHEMNVVEVEERDANFLKLWVSSILTAVDELSSQRMKVVFWLVQEAGRNRNVITKTTRELAEEIGISRTTVIDTLKVLERHDIIRRKTGVVFMSPEVVYKGSRQGRIEVLTRYRELPQYEEEEPTPAEQTDQLTRRMDLLMRELGRVEEELRKLQEEQAAAE